MPQPQSLIVATVGTSLLSNLRRAEIIPKDGPLPDVTHALRQLSSYEPADKICGAEINSLNNLIRGGARLSGDKAVQPPVALHFLVSDTDEGRWTGQLLVRYFQQWPEVSSDYLNFHVVEHLSHDDPETFATMGLRNLVRLAASLLRKPEYQSLPLRIIDATGGYKAQIAFALLIGQTLKVPVVYLFERFTYCIELPPLPVNFDRSLWLAYYGLFKRLSDEGQVPISQIHWPEIEPSIRDLLDRVEIDGTEYVALSPILELMHQGFETIAPVMEEPPPSDIPPDEKINLSKIAHHGRPSHLDTCLRLLAELPWIRSITYAGAYSSAIRWQLHAREGGPVDEIYLSVGDGRQAIKLRIQTTAENSFQRQWCFEHLKENLC